MDNAERLVYTLAQELGAVVPGLSPAPTQARLLRQFDDADELKFPDPEQLPPQFERISDFYEDFFSTLANSEWLPSGKWRALTARALTKIKFTKTTASPCDTKSKEVLLFLIAIAEKKAKTMKDAYAELLFLLNEVKMRLNKIDI